MVVNHVSETSGPVESGPGLARRLGLATATALVVGEVIGVAIFLTPAGMAKSLGSPFWLVTVWLVMGASAIGGALCFGALAARYPQAGGLYVYLREAYGARAAFLYGWLSLLVTDPGLTAMLAVGLAEYVRHLTPHSFSPWELKGVAVAAIVVLAGVNVVGVSLGSGLLRVLAALKLGLLGFLVIWGFLLGRGDWSNLLPFWTQRVSAEPLPAALASGLIGAFIAFAGWWDVSKISGEVCDPERTLPRALVLGVSIVTVVYIAVSVVFLYLVPPAKIASDEAFAALAGQALFGPTGEVIFAAIVVIAVAGSLAAMLMASPRVYYAMARDGLFFSNIAAIDPRRGTPARAIVLQAVLASLLALTGTFDQILSYFMVPTLVFLALTVAAVFVLRRRSDSPVEPETSLAAPGYPISPLLFLVPILVVIVLRILGDPWRASIGLLVVVLGVPVCEGALAQRRLAARTAEDTSPPAPDGRSSPVSTSTIGTDS
jgi:APA family basic amino acid/polyamine antiporter